MDGLCTWVILRSVLFNSMYRWSMAGERGSYREGGKRKTTRPQGKECIFPAGDREEEKMSFLASAKSSGQRLQQQDQAQSRLRAINNPTASSSTREEKYQQTSKATTSNVIRTRRSGTRTKYVMQLNLAPQFSNSLTGQICSRMAQNKELVYYTTFVFRKL